MTLLRRLNPLFAVVALLFVLLLPEPGVAQPLRNRFDRDDKTELLLPIIFGQEAPSSSEAGAVLGQVVPGIGVGGMGLLVGGVIGHRLELSSGCDYMMCGLAGTLVGAVAGETIGLPLGVHLASKPRGSFAVTFLGSAAVTGLGLALLYEAESPYLLLAVPVAQLAVSIAIERGARR